MRDSVWWWAMVALLIFGSCKPIAREEPTSDEQSVSLYRRFEALITKGNMKDARLIFKSNLHEGDLEAISRLLTGMMRRGKALELITFLGSWVTKSTRAADEILVKISASKSAREVEGLLSAFDQQVDTVKIAFARQHSAIAAFTTGQYRVSGLDNYLYGIRSGKPHLKLRYEHAMRQKGEDIPWLDYESWGGNIHVRLERILTRKTNLSDIPPRADGQSRRVRIKQAWKALRRRLLLERVE